MEGTLSEDDGLIRDNSMDLNDNTSDPQMALALGALGIELNLDGADIGEPCIGMEFDSDESAKEYYIAYANRVGFGVRMNKSRRSRKDDTVIMRRFVCTREGFHSKRVIYDDGKKKRKRGTTREGCMAMIEVIRKDHGKWVVTKLITEHTHMVAFPGKVRPPVDNPIIENNSALLPATSSGGFSNLKNFNRGIRVNPFGEGGEAQGLLEYLKRMQAENPAFFYAIQVDNNNCMTNVFWADAKARMAYQYFGDAVTFDTTYKKTKYMMPFATFRGVNNHLQSVTFGCALLMDETKGSYVWLFETWLSAMGGHHPDTLVTDRDKALEGAIRRVFPSTCHRFCNWHILSRCKQKLSDVYLKYATLKRDLKECINLTETVEEFDSRWEFILDKYNLWDNAWLQSLNEVRHQWAPAYQKGMFFPEISAAQRSESLNKFFKRNFNSKTSLLVFIARFDQEMATQYEKEAQADFAAAYTKPLLRTPSPIEKQAADVYTKEIFDKFQEEFIESLGYYADKIEDGPNSKYGVAKEDNRRTYIVHFAESDKKASCSCYKFESSGILCRHILRVFFIVGIRVLPQYYILKRWTRNATSCIVLDERAIENGSNFQDCLVAWYNDLCLDAVKYGIEGAMSSEIYKVAKAALQKALAEVVAAKNTQRKGQQNMQRFARLQKMQYKMPLPKLQTKKTPVRSAQDDVDKDKRSAKDDSVYGLILYCVFMSLSLPRYEVDSMFLFNLNCFRDASNTALNGGTH
ncbi:protein FAR1-RELATED SEQUENCE 5-like [Canna indica]|uniref:Protein FAR1-RELATED SEQUENCE n=1 Tax=Canna indica TaxID=4628 RepID=A0AAQ3KRW4_9LILI|nr:protein FAR1-RELATED SEQUENCE 5-like [Canna indica]